MAITCLDHPPAGQPARQPRAPTEKEQACYAQVLQHFQSLKDLPVSQEAAASSSSTSSERSPLTEREKFWLSEEQLYRFVRATKCDAKSAISRLEQTLLWRRTHKSQCLYGPACLLACLPACLPDACACGGCLS